MKNRVYLYLWFQKWFQQRSKHWWSLRWWEQLAKGAAPVLLGIWNQNSNTVIYRKFGDNRGIFFYVKFINCHKAKLFATLGVNLFAEYFTRKQTTKIESWTNLIMAPKVLLVVSRPWNSFNKVDNIQLSQYILWRHWISLLHNRLYEISFFFENMQLYQSGMPFKRYDNWQYS